MLNAFSLFAVAAAGTESPNPMLQFAPLVFIFVIFYFLLIRPQQKRQKEVQAMIEGIKKGDKVVTNGGIIGTIAGIQSDYVVLKVGENENTKMEVLKSAISGLRTEGAKS